MKIVVPILNPNMAEDLVRLAIALAGQERDATSYALLPQITVLGVATVPEETPLSQAASLVKAYRTLFGYIPPENNQLATVHTEVRVAREVWQGIVEEVREEDADVLLLYWKGFTQTSGKIYGFTIDKLMNDPPCDIVLARINHLPPVQKILVPLRTSGYSALALKFAANLSEEWGAGITVLHSPELNSDNAIALQNLIADLPTGAQPLTTTGQPLEAIIEAAPNYDLVMVGAGQNVADGNASETMSRKLAASIPNNLLVVKTRQPLPFNMPSADVPASLSEKVDRWFAQSTFHYREFRTMSSLTMHKGRTQTGISLLLPVYTALPPVALAETIKRAWLALAQECDLVDEIIVAAPAGMYHEHDAAIIRHKAHNIDGISLVEYPAEYQNSGMGAAIWHALPQARGDVVAWLDLSRQHFEARHIYGLLGPLLSYPEFKLATGFYSEDDPHHHSLPYPQTIALAVRPLLGSLFPELAGLIDPLCTAGAARHDLLDALPFFTNLGFNLALLIETLRYESVMEIAQVDLGSVTHSTPFDPSPIIQEALALLLHRIGELTQHPHLAQMLDLSTKAVQKENGIYSLKVSPARALEEFPPHLYLKGYNRPTF